MISLGVFVVALVLASFVAGAVFAEFLVRRSK